MGSGKKPVKRFLRKRKYIVRNQRHPANINGPDTAHQSRGTKAAKGRERIALNNWQGANHIVNLFKTQTESSSFICPKHIPAPALACRINARTQFYFCRCASSQAETCWSIPGGKGTPSSTPTYSRLISSRPVNIL